LQRRFVSKVKIAVRCKLDKSSLVGHALLSEHRPARRGDSGLPAIEAHLVRGRVAQAFGRDRKAAPAPAPGLILQ
jgi:hypothetical protein